MGYVCPEGVGGMRGGRVATKFQFLMLCYMRINTPLKRKSYSSSLLVILTLQGEEKRGDSHKYQTNLGP